MTEFQKLDEIDQLIIYMDNRIYRNTNDFLSKDVMNKLEKEIGSLL